MRLLFGLLRRRRPRSIRQWHGDLFWCDRLEQQLASVSAEIQSYNAVIKRTGASDLDEIVAGLTEARERRQRLVQQISVLAPAAVPTRVDWRSLERLARQKADAWRELLTRRPVKARNVLQELLEGAHADSTSLGNVAIGSRVT